MSSNQITKLHDNPRTVSNKSCQRERIPLSEHPFFSMNNENQNTPNFRVQTTTLNDVQCLLGNSKDKPYFKRNSMAKALSDITNRIEEPNGFNVKEKAAARMNSVQQPRTDTPKTNQIHNLISTRCSLSKHPLLSEFPRDKQFSNHEMRKKFRSMEEVSNVPQSPVSFPPSSLHQENEPVIPRRKNAKRKLPPSILDLRERLFSEDNSERTKDSEDEYSNIEHSRIVGFDDNDDGFLSDDNDDVDENLQSDEEADTPTDDEIDNVQKSKVKFKAVPKEYASLGAPSSKCEFCQAVMWKEERVNKNNKKGTPKYSICCRKGFVKLDKTPSTPSFLWQLYNDPEKGPNFKKCSRIYNSMFSFTSTGGTVDNSINNGGGPFIYRLNGQNHHVFGSLIPNDGDTPKFCQLYIYDTDNELENRMQWVDVKEGDKIDSEIVEGLMEMLDETNELVKEFRVARDRFKDSPFVDLKIVLKVCRSQSGRENDIGPSNEVAAIMVGDVEDPGSVRDVIVQKQAGGLQRVTNIHPKLMALQYPLLFPRGEDGFHKDIKYVQTKESRGKKRQKCSMKDFYSYKFQVRENEGMTPRLAGRLFQQYIVDAFSTIEQARLWWFRTHQTTLRNELYSHITDYLRKGDSDASKIGKSFILPAGFVGSKRYMQQNFQDALAVCRHIGHPDIFLTMTCNPLCDEINQMLKLIPGEAKSVDNPDIVARVFHLKLEQLLDDIQKKSFFGVCIGVMYVVEFQKRGLPHVHMLIWLDQASKIELKNNVDKFVSAEIPDPEKDPVGHEAVKSFMIHGPCGFDFPRSPCMKDSKCTRHFPKKYCPRTTFDESGFPLYKRRNNGVTVKVRKAELDNQWVVPFNRDLLVKYQCHMNVEICCHARSLKYLFKYCLKGHDRATVEIRGQKRTKNQQNDEEVIDEINAFFDGRYICGSEASYRTFGFPIHHRSISVERLSFHLPGKKNCTFRSNESLQRVAQREKYKRSKLEAFFFLNRNDENARQYRYDEIPRHYVWNDQVNAWTTRKKGFQVGRLIYTHHSAGEVWFLRLLLSKVRGPTSFRSLRTVDGVVCGTFQEACKKHGFLQDDDEWHEVLSESSKCGFPSQIRQLFVHIIVNCQVSDVNSLWTCHSQTMSDDILFNRRKLSNNNDLTLTEEEINFYALGEINILLRSIGKALSDYPQLPQPPTSYLGGNNNSLIIEETSYDKAEMSNEFKDLFSKCNKEQIEIYNAVINSILKNQGGLFFVYGSGGCGKTFLWRTLICKLRSLGKIVLPVASSGIAATLLPGGRTAHSRFKIPILLDDYSLCGIKHNSDVAELIKCTSLIIWDEAPMQHRYAFECLDRSLRDLMKVVDPKFFHIPFGGITILFGGDFRQTLPIVSYGSRADTVSACITRSRLWPLFKVFILKTNMRLRGSNSHADIDVLKIFAKWVLDIGNGCNVSSTSGTSDTTEFDINIPSQFCNLEESNSLETMMDKIYPNFLENYKKPKFLSERAILTPTNQSVSYLNSLIVEKLPGKAFSYFSIDHAEEFGGNDCELNMAFPIEYLNDIDVPGLPNHNLILKEGVVVMLMRNLNQTLGLCNGTRMIITKCLTHCVKCEVISGNFVGSQHFIPRIECCPSDSRLPFKLLRKQMPLQICYAMTINKSQGQSLKKAGLYLPEPVFSHGQFYVAVSRVTSPEGLKLFIDNESGCTTAKTKNVVYKEVFYNIPVA